MKSSEIRKAFCDYFQSKGHQTVASSSLVPGNDPTLLFTNAGMVQFKETFLGLEPRAYTRAVTAQRCVRAGGKHNDLENVGYTARHHTFFEMLGNFSFGDYFKREAIAYAWEFLTTVLHLPEERLWVTVYEEDDEAAAIWLNEMGVSPARFSRCGEKDNFWSMGDTGPCGPCTEIFYDHGPEIAGGPPGTPEAEGDRYIEIWNLVFMQYNRDTAGKLHSLPKPSVDTGMGLERIAAVVQGVHNNYDIDIFKHLIQAIAAKIPQADLNNPSFKVIADHIRACSFLVADGVLPSNEGRGYVLRRIIRRAIRHGHKLGLTTPFFAHLVAPLVEEMGAAYPELKRQQIHIERILGQEENQFAKTLDQGLRLLQEQLQALKNTIIPGEVVFKLYDTFGFPFDLTADIARERGLTVDEAGFNRCMQQQREQSQSASQFTANYSTSEQLATQSLFKGYEQDTLSSQVLELLHDGKSATRLQAGDCGALILDHTPFYAESGGQVGDRGEIRSGEAIFCVEDTQKSGQAIVHYGKVKQGVFTKNQSVYAEVDAQRRNAIRLNHTATHLLHAALKQIIGDHVQQKGSLVDSERARFDFSHFEALSKDQIQAIENLVNEQIRNNNAVHTELMDIESAKKSGAMALFGEKYTDTVRVLTMGNFSKELCGGTHARRTGDIGLFKITSESGIASGVRRIELVTGQYALDWVNAGLSTLEEAAAQLKTTVSMVSQKLSQLLQDAKQQEKELARLKLQVATQAQGLAAEQAEKVGDASILVKQVTGLDSQGLRTLVDQLKSKHEPAVVALVAVNEDKMQVIAGVSKSLIPQGVTAGLIIRHLCGKGGGRDDMAQGGGVLPADLDAKIAGIVPLVRKILTAD